MANAHLTPSETAGEVTPPKKSDDYEDVFKRADTRFHRCVNWESNARRLFMDDYRFANADADNGYQWPNDIRRNRDVDERPCLTINKTRQHNLQIVNDARQNKPGIRIKGTGNGATYESAQVYESVCRHIEYISSAQASYDLATKFQVDAGIGYFRVVTDYIDPKSFDQEIYIRPVQDPLTIYMDPDAKEIDKSDMKYCFVFDNIPREEFEQRYPEYKDKIPPDMAFGTGQSDWISKYQVRVAEYYEVVETADELFHYTADDGTVTMLMGSEIPAEIKRQMKADPHTRYRDTNTKEINWYLIVGEKVITKKLWPGDRIPIFPVIGEETVIEGNLDRKGHTRALKDPQRMYNYWTSSAVEFVALQGKSPWIAPARAIEGYEEYWNTANKINYSVLPYNDIGDDGEPLTNKPERPAPPQMAPAYLQGMEIAGKEMMLVSGQYEAQMGQPSNERSGVAIQERQRQGDNATYHFIDNLAITIRSLGKALIYLIPKIYDTERIIMVIAEDGTDLEVKINPGAAQALEQIKNENNEVVQRIFNPSVGRYEVQADVGPQFGTKRQEAFNAFTQILTQAPALTSIVGDLMMKSADFPLAEMAAARLRRMVPKEALGEGPTLQEQQMTQVIQGQQKQLSELMQQLAEDLLKMRGKDAKTEVASYDAETKRLDVVTKAGVSADDLRGVVAQLVAEIMNTHLGPTVDAASPEPSLDQGGGQQPTPEVPPVEGAIKGRDGRWYLKDNTRKGKYLMVA